MPNDKVDSGSYLEFLTLMHNMASVINQHGWEAGSMVVQDNQKRWTLRLTEKQEEVFTEVMSEYTPEALADFRAVLSNVYSSFNTELYGVITLLNQLLPKMKDVSAAERESYTYVERFEGEGKIVTPLELANMLARENPAYIRRLFTQALELDVYQVSGRTRLTAEDIAEMEYIQSESFIRGQNPDGDYLRVITRVGSDNRPVESEPTSVPRFEYIVSVIPSLLKMSEFSHKSADHFPRFVSTLPSVLAWVIGDQTLNVKSNELDMLMDVFHNAIQYNKQAQQLAKEASRLWATIHLGMPVYKDILTFVREQENLTTYTLESLMYRFVRVFPVLFARGDPDERATRMLMQCGVLMAYAKHKNVYIKRRT